MDDAGPPGDCTGRTDSTGERLLVGGPEHRVIVLVAYDPAWPARFAAERDTIVRALGQTAVRVEHVGSTSVPGLTAKPVVDVLLTVPDVEDEQGYVPALAVAGYELRVREPGHRMVRTPTLDVHVHVYTDGSAGAQEMLTFRDRLRTSATDRELYARTKAELARRDWPTMNHYAEAKTAVVREILGRAADS